jgi:hypothetical protein
MTRILFTPIDRHPLLSGHDWLNHLHSKLLSLEREQSAEFCQVLNSAALFLMHCRKLDWSVECLSWQLLLADSDERSKQYIFDALLNILRLRLSTLDRERASSFINSFIQYICANKKSCVWDDEIFDDPIVISNRSNVLGAILAHSLLRTNGDLDQAVRGNLHRCAAILGSQNSLVVESKILVQQEFTMVRAEDIVLQHIIIPLHRIAFEEQTKGRYGSLSEALGAISLLSNEGLLNHRFWRSYFFILSEVRRNGRNDLYHWLIDVGLQHFNEDHFLIQQINGLKNGLVISNSPGAFYEPFKRNCIDLMARVRTTACLVYGLSASQLRPWRQILAGRL